MFDLRYHVASLAAVFIALIVGIVIGVGLSGSGVTKEADLKLARKQRDEYHAQLDLARRQVAAFQKRGAAFSSVYPMVMRDLLRGKRVAVLWVGAVDGGIQRAIDATLADASSLPAVRTLAVNVPVDPKRLDDALKAQGPKMAAYVGDGKLGALGSELGAEFVGGGETPLWTALGRQLVDERSGSMRQPVDGVVVVRTVKPQAGDTARFLRGLYTGVASGGAPAVGVEDTRTTPSAVDLYADRGLSSVDDIDLDTGRAALALLLAGARSGSYGVDAREILPPVPGA